MIHLVRAGVDLLDAALIGDETLADALGHDVAPGWANFREALRPSRDGVASGPSDNASNHVLGA